MFWLQVFGDLGMTKNSKGSIYFKNGSFHVKLKWPFNPPPQILLKIGLWSYVHEKSQLNTVSEIWLLGPRPFLAFSQHRTKFQWLAFGFEAIRSEIIQLLSWNLAPEHFKEWRFQIPKRSNLAPLIVVWKLKLKINFWNLSENLKFL